MIVITLGYVLISYFFMGRFQSGQMGRTVNPLAQPSGVRIPPGPHYLVYKKGFIFLNKSIKAEVAQLVRATVL